MSKRSHTHKRRVYGAPPDCGDTRHGAAARRTWWVPGVVSGTSARWSAMERISTGRCAPLMPSPVANSVQELEGA